MSKKKTMKFTDSDIVIAAKPSPEFPEETPENTSLIPATEPTAEPKPTTQIITFANKAIPKRRGRTAKLFYPVIALTAGSEQSFFVPTDPKDFKKVTNSVRVFGYKHGFRVTMAEETSEDGTGIRVWRKA